MKGLMRLAVLALALPLTPVNLHAKAGDAPPAKDKEEAAKESSAERRERLRLQRNQRILSREELEAAMAPHLPAIKGCYQQHGVKHERATGELQLGMLIRPEGAVQTLSIRAPGVPGKELDTCVRKLSTEWRFPEKPGFTNAIIPFYFQKTNAKGAGPLKSCWSANGCPDRTRRSKKK